MPNKSVDIEILLRETVSEGVKKARDAVKELDMGSKSMADNLKKNIAENRQLIKEVTFDIKKLTLALSEAKDPAQKLEISADLKSARSALLELQGQNVDMQRRQIEASKSEEASQTSLIGSLGKWALGLASVTAALQIGKSIIESTKDTADKFSFGIEAAKTGLEQFWRTIATGDFSNFLDNMGRAIKAGYDFAESMDKVKESTWAMEMEEADVQKKRYQLLEDLRNKTLTKDERISKGEEYVKLEDDLAKKRLDNASLELEAYKKKAAELSGLQDKEIVNTLLQVNKATRIKAEAYNEALDFMNSRRVNKTPQEYAKYLPLVKNASEETKIYANAIRGVGKLKEDFIIGFVEAYKKVGQAEASGIEHSLRARTTLNGLKADIQKDDQDAEKKIKEAADLDNQIKATEELMKTAHGAELARLAEKLTALEKEKKLRDDLIIQAIMLAKDPTLAGKDGIFPLMTMRSGGLVTSRLGNKIDSKESKNDLVDTTKKFLKESGKKAANLSKEEVEHLKEQKKQRIEILNAAMDLTYEMAKQLGLGNEEMKLLGETLDTISKAAKGDYIGAAFSAMMAITDGLIKLTGDFGASKRAAGIKEINDLLTEQNQIVNESVRKGQEIEKRSEELRLLKEKQLQLTKNEQEAQDKLNNPGALTKLLNFVGGVGILVRAQQKKKLREEIGATQAELDAIDLQIKQAEQALDDLKVGGITENTLADAIAQGFQEGKTSVDDFASYMNQVLLDAASNIFKGDILADMQPLLERVRESLKDKTLTAEEKDAITAEAKRIAAENQKLWEDLTGSLNTGNNSGGKSGMTANIKAITEETASALGGNISAIRINMARSIENGNTSMGLLRQSLEYQLRTADNTEAMNKTLGNIDNRLSRFELDGIKVK